MLLLGMHLPSFRFKQDTTSVFCPLAHSLLSYRLDRSKFENLSPFNWPFKSFARSILWPIQDFYSLGDFYGLKVMTN